MKPILLTMTAFGPYRDKETIDFLQLEDRRLFVISGNTGAGKTTIFDAICFALYGSASGEDRAEPRMLRSHFADEEQHMSVDFTFAVGKRTFRVFRQMAHRKGSNKSETGGKVELYELSSGQEVPCVDRFTIADVNSKLEAVIGLTKEQFSQIVMLPQGEFRKLLTSDTENKEEILRRIFRTGLYQKLEDRFQQKNRELKDALKDASLKVDIYVKQTEETLPQREESPLFATLQQEFRSAAQVMEGLLEEKLYYSRLAEDAEAEKAALTGQLDEQEVQLRHALSFNSRFDELAQRRAKHEEMQLQKQEITQLEQELELAEQAARIEPYEEQEYLAKRSAEGKQREVEAKRLDVEAATLRFAQAQEQYRVEEAKEAQRRQAVLEVQRLTELVPLVQTLEAKRLEVQRLLAEETNCLSKLEIIEAKLVSSRVGKRETGDRIKQLEAENAGLPEKLERLDHMRNKYNLVRILVDLEKQLAQFKRDEKQRELTVGRLKAEHDSMEQLWIEGQAGMLAAHLHDGRPCPVCGSEVHPQKAEAGEQMPSREALQQMKEQLRHAESELHEAKAQAAAASSGIEGKSAEMSAYGIDPAHLLEQLNDAELEGKRLRAETDRLKEQAATLSQLRAELERLDGAIEALQGDKERILAEQQQQMLERSTKQSLLDNELARIPEPLRSPHELELHLKEQQSIEAELAAGWKAAQERIQLVQTMLTEEKAKLESLQRQLEEMESNWQQTSERFLHERTRAGFISMETYLAAKLPEPKRQAVKEQIRLFNTMFFTLGQQISELETELSGKLPVDLTALNEGIALLKQRSEQTASRLQSARHYRQEADRLAAAISSAYARVRELEVQLEQVMDIYQMLKGDNAMKISFERYILIEYLEQILYAANVRLRDLSGGQFMLQRSDRLEARGRQSGLGLDVYDAYTGQNRDVKSLSGGEKFNASLCLALGMTDVIQSHQGGVSIEMMFIDEGFGSLDEESLNKAITTLIDLQRAGRMIGVISHVQELKQAFPAVLEVSKTKEGYSRTMIVLK
ncbi:AAA family ATPase [Paenibacillus abyssi]|uniref:Nuclease SbcCD subunit C n=1 Tax=Paenibacillus abyssi TaxID=1340531 RepID=A0A917G749_9BACL|nr:SMC family ATPase [Paenibacillus abyssi]GGG26159.1 nuclease SbcCD subunit C [Paenibacillus abyssi]